MGGTDRVGILANTPKRYGERCDIPILLFQSKLELAVLVRVAVR